MLTNCIMEEIASGSEIVLCHVPLREKCKISVLGLWERVAWKTHSIIEQYRPSPFVAMLIRGFYGGIRGMGVELG